MSHKTRNTVNTCFLGKHLTFDVGPSSRRRAFGLGPALLVRTRDVSGCGLARCIASSQILVFLANIFVYMLKVEGREKRPLIRFVPQHLLLWEKVGS
jgi:hypothetical protein